MPDLSRLLLAGLAGAVIALGGSYALERIMVSGPGAGKTAADAGGGESSFNANSQFNSQSQEDIRFANIELALGRMKDELAQLRLGIASAPSGSAGAPSDNRPPRPQGLGEPVLATAELLTQAGLGGADANTMVERLDELALARLEADFQVRTSSGESAKQARADRRTIPSDRDVIRGEFGDGAYDKYLFALNQPNRVEVASVLRDSTAQGAGVQSGDFLRSLDGEPLFSVRDLTQRIREGDADRTYSLIVERNGETIEAWVAGGPLGVRVNGAVADPGG